MSFPQRGADYDLCSALVLCHADKAGLKIYAIEKGAARYRVLAHDRIEADEIVQAEYLRTHPEEQENQQELL
jgi:hypothetical protein